MKYQKKVSVGEFAKKGVDIKNGDIVTIANEGVQKEGTWGLQDIFLVKLTNGQEKNVNFNQVTMNAVIDAYGEDSINWIGKPVKVWIITQNIAGEFKEVIYLAHPQAKLGKNGFQTDDINGDLDLAAQDEAQ